MTPLDWIIVAFAVLLGLYGARQGFVVGALSLAGFVLGAFLGTRIAGTLLPEGQQSPYAPLIALAGAVIVGGLLATAFGGFGLRLRVGALRLRGFGPLDALLGALFSAAVALVIAWVAGAAAVQLPGRPQLARTVQRSQILRRLNEVLPPSGPILNAISRFDPLPRINGPSVALQAPKAAITRAPGVRAAAGSVVRVVGTACGLGIEGSGWVAGSGLVVTNAHVVAGEDDTSVQVQGVGTHLPARAVVFDPRNDIAVLRVGGLGAPALALEGEPAPGTSAAILGFPENGPYDVEAGRIGEARSVLTQDAYGRGPVTRPVLPLRGVVRSGNSGGPLVDAAGRVVGTVFASTVSSRHPAGYAVPDSVVRSDLRRASGTVSTGPCAH